MNTIGTSDYQNKKAAAILQEYSAKKYGRKKEFVEAEIQARLGILSQESEAAADAAIAPIAADATTPPTGDKTVESQPTTDALPTPPTA